MSARKPNQDKSLVSEQKEEKSKNASKGKLYHVMRMMMILLCIALDDGHDDHHNDHDHDDSEIMDYADHSGDDYTDDYNDEYLEKDPKPRFCSLPKRIGKCRAALPRYYYHKVAQECVPFTYGGCRGNRNRFMTKEKCDCVCKRGPFRPIGVPQ